MASPNSLPGPQHAAYFPALTGVRAVAACMVFANHYRPKPGLLPALLDLILLAFQVGLPIFFVLSGLLISYRYEDAFRAGTMQFGKYLLRRYARLYPLYFVLTIIVLIWQQNNNGWEWFLNLTLLKSYFLHEKFTGIAPAWSLTVDETFYLLAPFLFLLFRKIQLRAIILLLLFGSGLVFLSQWAGGLSFMNNLQFMMDYTFFGLCFEFYCGYRLAVFLKKNPEKINNNYVYTLVGSFCTLAAFAAIAFAHTQVFAFPFPVSPLALVNNFILPISIALWFYGLVTEKTKLSQLLSTKFVQLLGRSSYAFYLIHAGVFYKFIYSNITTSKLITFILLNIISVGIYYFFEEPVNQFIRHKTDAWYLRKKMKQQPDFLSQ